MDVVDKDVSKLSELLKMIEGLDNGSGGAKVEELKAAARQLQQEVWGSMQPDAEFWGA